MLLLDFIYSLSYLIWVQCGWYTHASVEESFSTPGSQFSNRECCCLVPWSRLTLCDSMDSMASLSFTISWSWLKLMSIESVMSSNHLILCCSLLFLHSIFPSIRVFSSESGFTSGGQSIGASASASVFKMNIQGWFPLGLTGLILLSKGLSRV